LKRREVGKVLISVAVTVSRRFKDFDNSGDRRNVIDHGE
jgi:hypothetical protein